MQRVLVQDVNAKPLMPCHPARARRVLRAQKAVCVRRVPFTIRLTERSGGETQPLRIKLDPGSKQTGVVLTIYCRRRGWMVVWAANLSHRGGRVHQRMNDRRMFRRGRRARKTRYRPPRFDNRRRPEGWLPPSVISRVDNATAWVRRLMKTAPITQADIETVRFDTHKLQNSEIEGIEYQRGTLFGTEAREYVLYKFSHTCVYCGDSDGILELDHVVPRSRGGSNRVSNLVCACHDCNQDKGSKSLETFLAERPQVLAAIKRQLKAPLRDAAALNATRFAIARHVCSLGLEVRTWTGGRTKFNRTNLGYIKDHWVDAACVGETGAAVTIPSHLTAIQIQATGRGQRRTHRNNRYGFPQGQPRRVKRVAGFSTGDLVRLNQPRGRYRGVHIGRLAGVRERGDFDIRTASGVKITAPWHRFERVQRADGYAYA